MKDSGLPVGSELIHNTPEEFWSQDAVYKVDQELHKEITLPCLQTKCSPGFGRIAVVKTVNPKFWHIHVTELPLRVFPTGVREALFDLDFSEKATEAGDGKSL